MSSNEAIINYRRYIFKATVNQSNTGELSDAGHVLLLFVDYSYLICRLFFCLLIFLSNPFLLLHLSYCRCTFFNPSKLVVARKRSVSHLAENRKILLIWNASGEQLRARFTLYFLVYLKLGTTGILQMVLLHISIIRHVAGLGVHFCENSRCVAEPLVVLHKLFASFFIERGFWKRNYKQASNGLKNVGKWPSWWVPVLLESIYANVARRLSHVRVKNFGQEVPLRRCLRETLLKHDFAPKDAALVRCAHYRLAWLAYLAHRCPPKCPIGRRPHSGKTWCLKRKQVFHDIPEAVLFASSNYCLASMFSTRGGRLIAVEEFCQK